MLIEPPCSKTVQHTCSLKHPVVKLYNIYVQVTGLSEITTSSPDEVMRMLTKGKLNLKHFKRF